jgi:alpha-beta hydrolase superfamily lysophospholipase
MKKTPRVFLNLLGISLLVFLTILVGRGFQARSLPDLEAWHSADLGDVRAGELAETATLADYLRREDAVFEALKSNVLANVPASQRTASNRYSEGGPLDPTRRGPADGNRTFELAPADVRGGALLLHGLTDAPYSVRPIADALRRIGYVALAPRLPGHGTAPSGLVSAEWQDWMSVVRLAARHVRAKAGDGKPFVLVGYSNGGALAVKYAQDALEGSGLPRPDRIVLMSPMIGLTPFAGLARVVSLLHRVPYFEKNAWLDVVPEYNPYKYNSFPANAAIQTSALTKALNAQTERLAADGRLKGLAPVLAFQSLADDTVLTEAIVHRLFDRLPENGSELVLFDVNRQDALGPFLKLPEEALARDLGARTDLKYRLTLVTNARRDTRDVVARSWGPGPAPSGETALGLAWPSDVFSLSHVAIPFPESDDLYGRLESPAPSFGFRLGRVEPRGERAVLTVPADQWMRLTWNPFYPWMETRVAAWAATSSSGR